MIFEGYYCPMGSSGPIPCSREILFTDLQNNEEKFDQSKIAGARFNTIPQGLYCDEGTSDVSFQNGPYCPKGKVYTVSISQKEKETKLFELHINLCVSISQRFFLLLLFLDSPQVCRTTLQ
jgi:hypothetical protein